jgi:hypothetical protein
LRREGIDVSVSMVGRILTKLMARGVVTPVPMGLSEISCAGPG